MKKELMILHGALGCSEQFSEWEKALSPKYNCHRFDLPGHGVRSNENTVFSVEIFSEALQNYIHEKNIFGTNILGYSMGGYVALYAALQNPGLVGNIMTLATKFDWNPQSSKKEAGYLQPQLMQTKVPKLVEQLRERHGSRWENVVNKTANMMIHLGENPLLTPASIKEIKNQIKFAVGDRDKMVSVEETFTIYRNAENASFCVMPNTGHLPESMRSSRVTFEVDELISTSTPKG